MAIREIVKEGNDCLRKVCRPVEKFDERLAILLDDMAQTMYEGNGVGLAAPQVGVLRRVVVIDCGDQLYELINPEIIAQAGALDEAEGCLSSPGEYALVRRPEKVAVRAQDRHGKEFVLEGDHLLARRSAMSATIWTGGCLKILLSGCSIRMKMEIGNNRYK